MAVFSVLMIIAIYHFLTPKKELPVFNPKDVNPKLVDESLRHKGKNHKIAAFELINQNGDTITQEAYKNKIYVTDFFFTRCQTICPVMTNNMGKLQEVFKSEDDIKFLSLSVTPVMDSVPILREYADKMGIIDTKWNITTGDKKHIYELARKSYFVVLDEGDGGVQDFIHTENFVLVDKKQQIRGFYDGTDTEDIQRLISDIRILQTEFQNK
ncbi:MAG: SCO family protein [Lutibacter sp.]|nr:SCO family protein [Lutibacter sp.]